MKEDEVKKTEDAKKEEVITNDEAQTLEGGVANVESSEPASTISGDGYAVKCCNKGEPVEVS
ncbi:hypothetical protein [Proteiniphilum sp.]|uniref:hypothetical protein n=1 Tax=Proteiniphilum sp. TaxID=1926877 RepID=UPI00332656B2